MTACTQRRILLAGLLGLATTTATIGARAQPAAAGRTYVVLSLAGDAMTLVTFRTSVGSVVDQNLRETVPVAGQLVERTVLASAQRNLLKADPEASVRLLVASSADSYARQGELLNADRLVAPPWLADGLKREGATHLLLVTKHRAPARIMSASEELGTGALSGVGFYFDSATRFTSTSNGDHKQGFMAPYAYLRVSLVEVATGRVVGTRAETQSRLMTSERGAGTSPWETFTAAEKSEGLEGVVDAAVSDAVAALVRF